VFAGQLHELEQWEARVKQLVDGDIATLNAQAAQLGIGFVAVPQ